MDVGKEGVDEEDAVVQAGDDSGGLKEQHGWNVGDEVDACWGQNRVWYAGTILEIHQTKNGSTRYTVGEFENDDPADVGATYVSLYSFFSTASYYCCQRLVCLCAVVSINPLFF